MTCTGLFNIWDIPDNLLSHRELEKLSWCEVVDSGDPCIGLEVERLVGDILEKIKKNVMIVS